MDTRQNQLTELHSYIEGVDKEVTLILQSLQWDRQHILEGPSMVTCKYDPNHRVPPDKLVAHEKQCFLKSQGYSKEDRLLPDPVDQNSNTLVTLGKADIKEIIDNASKTDPLFKRGPGCQGSEPLTLERLQATYTADERRAIHDAVVNAVPSCHDLADLALPSFADEERKSSNTKSRLQILSELRDMKRRRPKYRVAAKTRNYSAVLRDVIRSQMEFYTGKEVDITSKSDTSNQQTDNCNETTNYQRLDKRQEFSNTRQRSRERNRFHDRRRYDDPSSKDRHKERRDRHRPRRYDGHESRRESNYHTKLVTHISHRTSAEHRPQESIRKQEEDSTYDNNKGERDETFTSKRTTCNNIHKPHEREKSKHTSKHYRKGNRFDDKRRHEDRYARSERHDYESRRNSYYDPKLIINHTEDIKQEDASSENSHTGEIKEENSVTGSSYTDERDRYLTSKHRRKCGDKDKESDNKGYGSGNMFDKRDEKYQEKASYSKHRTHKGNYRDTDRETSDREKANKYKSNTKDEYRGYYDYDGVVIKQEGDDSA